MPKLFVIAFARDKEFINNKIDELENLGAPYKIICGEPFDHPNVEYRPRKGKFDAINFSLTLIPEGTEIVVFNDADSKIRNFGNSISIFRNERVGIVFGKDIVKAGPQVLFHQLLFPILKILPILANGDLMLMRWEMLKRIYLKPCKAEDAYILFRALELGYKAVFCEECFVETEKTQKENEEEAYKRRTVGGIYQALSYTHPPLAIRIFYTALPFGAPLLLVLGRRGFFWTKGILLGFVDYLRGDRSGSWQNS